MKALNFKLTKDADLKISSFAPIRSLGGLYWVRIELINGSKKVPIYDSVIGDGLHMICERLKSVLANKAHIIISDNQDLGYAYNKYLNLPKNIWFKTEWFGKNVKSWFFSGRNFNTNVHLYNDAEGNIIFHVSKSGRWYERLKKGEPGYVPYKDFMKNYKPLYVGTISRSVAKNLLDRFERLHTRVWENQRRYDADCVAAIKAGTKCKWCVRDEKYRKELRASRTLKSKNFSKK